MALAEVSEREIIELIASVKALTIEVRETNEAVRQSARVLFGEKGDDGITRDVHDLLEWKKGVDKKIDRLVYPVVLTFILAIGGIGWILLIFGTPLETLLRR